MAMPYFSLSFTLIHYPWAELGQGDAAHVDLVEDGTQLHRSPKPRGSAMGI
jgi:hypothetical protein